jgi:hypothetical protein
MMHKKAGYGETMKRAKSGTKVKKAGYGGKAASMVPPNSKMKAKAGSSLKKPSADQVGLKKLPTAVRNKMGYAKKGMMVVKKAQAGGVASKNKKAPMVDADGAFTKVQERTIAGKKMAKKGASVKKAKSGAKMGKCKHGCN